MIPSVPTTDIAPFSTVPSYLATRLDEIIGGGGDGDEFVKIGL